MKKSIFPFLMAMFYITMTATAQNIKTPVKYDEKTEQITQKQDNATETANGDDLLDNSVSAQQKLKNCPLWGTPDCPLVKNCPKKGMTECPYKATASADNSKFVAACCKGKKASYCAKK